jgi:hypothetical protein
MDRWFRSATDQQKVTTQDLTSHASLRLFCRPRPSDRAWTCRHASRPRTVAATRDEVRNIASNAIATQNPDKRLGSIATSQVPDAMIRDLIPRLYLSSVVLQDRYGRITPAAHVQIARSPTETSDGARAAFAASHPGQHDLAPVQRLS